MSDYNFLMESRLSPEQLQTLNFLSRLAATQGLNFYLVGGAVRDLVHGQQVIRDLDFVVEGNPEKILRHLEASPSAAHSRDPLGDSLSPGIDYVVLDKRLAAADVRFKNGVRAEIAASRNELYSRPGKPPDVVPATIFEDLKRRDFSANAMAISLHPNSRGLMLDPTNGAADITNREFRVLHSRSFSEDPLRIYRILRLCLRLDFKPEERTKNYLEAASENRVWEQLAPQQQGRELEAILEEENPGRVLKMLAERGLLRGLDRKLATARIPYDHFTKIRSVARSLPAADLFLLNFHCLTERMGGAQRVRLAKKIMRHPGTIKAALNLEHDARKLTHLLSSAKAGKNSFVYNLLSQYPQHLLLFLLAYYPQVKVQNRVKAFLFKFPQLRAKLPRMELQAMGMPFGPKFEKVLEQVFLDQLDGNIRTQVQLTRELRQLSGIKEPEPKPKLEAIARRGKKSEGKKTEGKKGEGEKGEAKLEKKQQQPSKKESKQVSKKKR